MIAAIPSDWVRFTIDKGPAGYSQFMAVKRLPIYRFVGDDAIIPACYAKDVGVGAELADGEEIDLPACMFDYQRDIAIKAIRRRKFAAFLDCGLGKSLVEFAFLRHAAMATGKPALLVTPLMVVPQMADEWRKFMGGDLPVIAAKNLPAWLESGKGVAVTNWDAMREGLDGRRLGGLVADESSLLKSHYGAFGAALIEMGRGVPYKLCATGTPAPNDRIEFANHAVFLDQARTVNEFLARYFVNRGQTNERWELKPHALRPFYRALSAWSVFLSDPGTYGYRDNAGTLPPIRVHIHEIELDQDCRDQIAMETGSLFVNRVGGIAERSKIARVGKTSGAKLGFIRQLVESWPNESTIVWCRYNGEQDAVAAMFPGCANIDGSTPHEDRVKLVAEFKAGERRILVSKPKILGFGLNLQRCTRQVFSTIQDSYEEYYQAVKRSNRVGSTKPLDVHLPVLETEAPMMENVLRKAAMVDRDTVEQERLYKEGLDE